MEIAFQVLMCVIVLCSGTSIGMFVGSLICDRAGWPS